MSNKNIQLEEIIKMFRESISFVALYKVLIVFGIVFALFGGTALSFNINASPSFNLNMNNISKSQTVEDREKETERDVIVDISDRASSTVAPIFVVLSVGTLCCFVVVISVLGMYVRGVSQNVLIGALDIVERGQEMKFKSLWKFGHSKVLKTIIVDILGLFANILLILISIPLMCLCCSGMLVSFLGGLLISVVVDIAKRNIVIKNLEISTSLSRSWDLFTNNLVNFVWYVVSLMVLSISWGVFSLFAGVVLLVLLSPMWIAFLISTVILLIIFSPLGVIFGVFVGILFVLVSLLIGAVLSGPLFAVVEVWKTKYWMLLTSEE